MESAPHEALGGLQAPEEPERGLAAVEGDSEPAMEPTAPQAYPERVPHRTTLATRMQAARQRARDAGVSEEAIEAAYLESIEVVEYRVVTELLTVAGWTHYAHVPLSSHEVAMLDVIRAGAARQQRSPDAQPGDTGAAWIESRVVGTWQRD